jgi:hypothetical protein
VRKRAQPSPRFLRARFHQLHGETKIAPRRIGRLKRLLKAFGPAHEAFCNVAYFIRKLNCHYIERRRNLHCKEIIDPMLSVVRYVGPLNPTRHGIDPSLRALHLIRGGREKRSSPAVPSPPASN